MKYFRTFMLCFGMVLWAGCGEAEKKIDQTGITVPTPSTPDQPSSNHPLTDEMVKLDGTPRADCMIKMMKKLSELGDLSSLKKQTQYLDSILESKFDEKCLIKIRNKN